MLKQSVWWRRFFCICFKKAEDEDDDEIHEITYSSGPEEQKSEDIQLSDEERAPINTLSPEARKERVRYLWKRAIAKIKGAVLVLIRFGDLEKRINLFGTSI
jgi:hypothetical protein